MEDLIVVLNDGETFTNLAGCSIQQTLPEDEEEIDNGIVPDGLERFPLGEVKDSDTILRWFHIFFPNMEVKQDTDGQVVIHTGIYE